MQSPSPVAPRSNRSLRSPVTSPSTPKRVFSGQLPSRRTLQTQLAQSMAKSMTIDEMRALHQRALRDAEAKKTELRLVLASRYRELVGSSDEVISMKDRAHELHELVQNLPGLCERVANPTLPNEEETKSPDEIDKSAEDLMKLRQQLASFPRSIHRALHVKDVYKTTAILIELLSVIASQTNEYPLANALSTKPVASNGSDVLEPILKTQIHMLFLQMQKLPDKIRDMANDILSNASTDALESASALASLYYLREESNDTEHFLTTYFDAKAKLLVSTLSELDDEGADAEAILSRIVLILQYDVILHPYQIFMVRSLPESNCGSVLQSLPHFDKDLINTKCSKFLATHLPIIRTKVKSVLVSIAGTTASALGQIRQSLYDKTDGTASSDRFAAEGFGTWDEAVFSMVDLRKVSADAEASQQQKFSLWGALFSNTFSSLVHSLLSTAFQSVHTKVVSTLRDALANAPPASEILPHEAYLNTLQIATQLDQSLQKVSADAHELLVHAEERVESERRLRQSLYVQTCEIMGRLICEVRRMASEKVTSDGTRELVIGRLCFLLKFRLMSLRTLLSPDSSPAALHSTGGMISFVDLQSAFELADDDEDGLVSFDEVMQAVESAFSGTPFNGTEMVRETLLLAEESDVNGNVTLSELMLLAARGTRHSTTGDESALGAVQRSLDGIVSSCFSSWAHSILTEPSALLGSNLHDFVKTASTSNEAEWKRIFFSEDEESFFCKGVSPHMAGYFLTSSLRLNSSLCPADTLSPVPSQDYALSLGISKSEDGVVETLEDVMRRAIFVETYLEATSLLEDSVTSEAGSLLETGCLPARVQLYVDTTLLKYLFIDNNAKGIPRPKESDQRLKAVVKYISQLLQSDCDQQTLSKVKSMAKEKHSRFILTGSLFLSSTFGDASSIKETISPSDGQEPNMHLPLASSRRFTLLPVQADRSLKDIQIRGKYAKDNLEATDAPDTSSGNVIAGGFGFLSGMLKGRK